METLEKKGDRVRKSSSSLQNQHVDDQLIQNIKGYTDQGPEAIDARIQDLDQEWDMERALETNAAIVALTGTVLGAFVNRRWLILPVIVTTFLAQHAIQGWCPPVSLLRKIGIRTRPEIDREKYVLKALRGDFKNIRDTKKAWVAVNK